MSIYGCNIFFESSLGRTYVRFFFIITTIIIKIIVGPGGNTQQDTSYTATYLPPRKLYKLDESDT